MKKTGFTKLINAQIISGGKIRKGEVCIAGNRIVGQLPEGIEYAEIDCGNNYLMPGFIDVHLHGGGGSDFMDGDVSAYRTVALAHLRHGTTTMLPTLLTASHEEIVTALKAYNVAVAEDSFLRSIFCGVHMEGPYLSKKQKGAQDESYIKDFTSREYEAYYGICPEIRRWSVAPELQGLEEFDRFCEKKGIILSVAHTDALAEQIIEKWTPRFKLFTHLYSGMKGVVRIQCFRHAGAVEAAYLLQEAYTETIADGRHLPKELLQLVYRIKGSGKNILITDAIRAAGTSLKNSFIGSKKQGLPIVIRNGVAFLEDKSSFAGSIATGDLLVRNMVSAGIPLEDSVRMITETPARLFGLKGIGSIRRGFYADLVLTDHAMNVLKVYKRGIEI